MKVVAVMELNDLKKEIASMEERIASLPRGSVSYKTIKGKKQPYLQWTEDGKRKSRYLKLEEREEITAAVTERKELEKQLKELRSRLPSEMQGSTNEIRTAKGLRSRLPAEEKGFVKGIRTGKELPFETRVITGSGLSDLCRRVEGFQCRDCMRILDLYLEKSSDGRVCLLYGLRRTGKTTMLLQAAAKLPADQTVYIKIMPSDDFSALERDMRRLQKAGYKYVFIDEVTLLKDFIDCASLFSDIYAMMGMKVVLSGTDSLGFLLSTGDELYDRAYTIHTTFIPFREYARLLGIRDIDEYIRYGGTFRVGETDFDDPELLDETVSFRDDETTRRYIDTAIAHNIQHSLAHYRSGTHFRHLIDLYDAGELTNAVNRIIEDINHRFLLSVLTRDFASSDLGITRKNLRKNPDPEKRSDALTLIDEESITERLKAILDIRNKDEVNVELTGDHIREIKEYLYLLDLIVDCPIETIGGEKPLEHIIFTQPGMRYSQAQALVFSLMKDDAFSGLDAKEKNMVTNRILEEVRGRMMEEIILLETKKKAGRRKNVFKLQFVAGEYDMVIADTESISCSIYEVKHSRETVPAQYRFLIDEEKCRQTEHRYGPITEKMVIYRGKTQVFEGIRYKNVEEYLEQLG